MYRKIQKAKGPDSQIAAYDYAIFLLSEKLRTSGEIREKMRLKQYNAEIIENVIKGLMANKYLDDERYAEIFLDNLKKYKTFGFYGIKKKLLEKKLPQEIIERVLNVGLDEAEELTIAQKLLKKESDHLSLIRANRRIVDKQKSRYQSPTSRGRSGARLAQKLRARGFRGEVIAKLIF